MFLCPKNRTSKKCCRKPKKLAWWSGGQPGQQSLFCALVMYTNVFPVLKVFRYLCIIIILFCKHLAYGWAMFIEPGLRSRDVWSCCGDAEFVLSCVISCVIMFLMES